MKCGDRLVYGDYHRRQIFIKIVLLDTLLCVTGDVKGIIRDMVKVSFKRRYGPPPASHEAAQAVWHGWCRPILFLRPQATCRPVDSLARVKPGKE